LTVLATFMELVHFSHSQMKRACCSLEIRSGNPHS
jgi:hypothetical protein